MVVTKGTMSKTWIEVTADEIEAQVLERKGPNARIVCESGISPSGPIHLGNLREIMTVHLVAEELKRRGRQVEHIHSWDDFDRLRKLPAGVPDSFATYIGQPLSDVPDPFGKYNSYADRYVFEFEDALADMGIQPKYIRQSQAYREHRYVDKIKTALSKRLEIFDILSTYQTLEQEKSLEERREEYYPFRVYCSKCNTDYTRITSYDDLTSTLCYSCNNCGNVDCFDLCKSANGKLVWKVDWPMRWSFEQVDFEPGGEDHSAPGSSFTVGQRIVKEIFDGWTPYYIGYAFVGISGRSKISSSIGTNATPRSALHILEPSILRWLYIRRNPDQKFSIDFGTEVLRIYDEWDNFAKKVKDEEASANEKSIYAKCVSTSAGIVKTSTLPVSFRLLSSAADITQGNMEQVLRIVSDHTGLPADHLQVMLEPRLSCAIRWATQYLPEDERTNIRSSFSKETYGELSDQNKRGIELLINSLDSFWGLDELTKLVYGIPKTLLGLPMDAPPSSEIKTIQREFFVAVYRMICDSDTGPRLPTLFLSLGKEKLRKLLVLN